MHTIHRSSIFITVVALSVLATFLISGQVSPTLADDEGGLGKEISGTYVAVQDDAAQTLQISEDGNMSVIFSSQFSGGALVNLFSDNLGSWKKTGQREITARTVVLNFEKGGDGTFVGVATTTYLIKFDKKFQTANVTCEGAVFPLGVNPILDPETTPLVEFTCGDLEFDRVPVEGEDDNDD